VVDRERWLRKIEIADGESTRPTKKTLNDTTTTGSSNEKLEVVLVLESYSVLDQHEYIKGSVQFSNNNRQW